MMSILGKRRGGLEVYQQVMEGAEPFRFEGNEVGVLVSHGFTGTTQSVRPLGEALAEEGYTVIGPRLEGHGTSMEDHASSTASDWISSIEAGLTWLQQRTSQTFFTGLSLGGMFALYFAAKYSANMPPDRKSTRLNSSHTVISY